MPQFKAITSDSEFEAKSFDEMMKPHLLVKAEYDEHMKMLDEQDKTLSDLEPYVGDGTARRIYDSMRGKMEEAADNFGTPFFLQNLPLIQGLKSQYNRTKSILGAAIKNQELERQHRQKLLDADDSLEFIYENGRGQFTEPNVDDFLMNGSPNFYRVSGKEVSTMMQNATRSFQGRLATASSSAYLTEENGMPGVRIRNEKKEGVSAYVQLDWLKNPEKHTKEIKDALNMFYAHDPQQADAVYNAIMAGDMANEWNNVKSSTHYGKMTNDSKRRLDAWMDHGAFVGLNHYDENKNSSFSPHYPNPNRSGSGSGNYWNIEHIPVETIANLTAGIDDAWKKLYKASYMWGYRHDYENPEGGHTMKHLFNSGFARDNFNDALWFDPDEPNRKMYEVLDDIVNSETYRQRRKDANNPNGKYISDYTFWNEDGTLISEKEFADRYEDTIRRLNEQKGHNGNNEYWDSLRVGDNIDKSLAGGDFRKDYRTRQVRPDPLLASDVYRVMTRQLKNILADDYYRYFDDNGNLKQGAKLSKETLDKAFRQRWQDAGAEQYNNLYLNTDKGDEYFDALVAQTNKDKIYKIDSIKKDSERKNGNTKNEPVVVLSDEKLDAEEGSKFRTNETKGIIKFSIPTYKDKDGNHGIVMHVGDTNYWIPIKAMTNEKQDFFNKYFNEYNPKVISILKKKDEYVSKMISIRDKWYNRLNDNQKGLVDNGYNDLTDFITDAKDKADIVKYWQLARGLQDEITTKYETLVKQIYKLGASVTVNNYKI